jgi:hypothetical protein
MICRYAIACTTPASAHHAFHKSAWCIIFRYFSDSGDELIRLVNVMLSKQSIGAMLDRLKQVAREFSLQHQEDARLPFEEKFSISFLLAARPWMPQSFQALLREPPPASKVVRRK